MLERVSKFNLHEMEIKLDVSVKLTSGGVQHGCLPNANKMLLRVAKPFEAPYNCLSELKTDR